MKVPQNWLSISQSNLSGNLEVILEDQLKEEEKTPLSSIIKGGVNILRV